MSDPMHEYEPPPPPQDADRTVTETEEELDPEAPTDSLLVNPPEQDADRPAPTDDDVDDALQQENAGTSLDQPSDAIS